VIWVFAIVVVVVLGGVAVVAAGRGEPMAEAYDDRPDALVPADRPLVAADLRRVRFSVALRGYRMSEVDALLTRLSTELEAAGRGAGEDAGDAAPDAARTTPPHPVVDEPEQASNPAADLVDPPTS
jgi:DivIVA domain-containing protein